MSYNCDVAKKNFDGDDSSAASPSTAKAEWKTVGLQFSVFNCQSLRSAQTAKDAHCDRGLQGVAVSTGFCPCIVLLGCILLVLLIYKSDNNPE